ncbi:UDP-N-acetylmuramoyl-L-alanine--D-glutamate ligase [Desulfosoma caldarium]|uniref:UDP-N-acetylmuramoylalanine--D-glutamate ligase n=1 Tax=Desulfosoma caldarium TaxID=610254 RepID=A0A3N1UZH6_9BACT|nr:UDP-N-acetylmuramoyl-L-alanine--D-glutamate ligase [Desulfosoma caldarium]ROQ93251.1 UDP-N-acetylmuramoylalanine--D-glutamate ligase [Desulfosoma caldarium]
MKRKEVSHGCQEKPLLVVVGLGVSGQAACRWGLRQGYRVLAMDHSQEPPLRCAATTLEAEGVDVRLGVHRLEDFLHAELVVVSPGVPVDTEVFRAVQERGIPLIGELEWAWRFLKVPTMAVTGTNGKTTTTELLGTFLQSAGFEVFVGGNIGTPLTGWLADHWKELSNGTSAASLLDWCVLEVSSFQLDTAPSFMPDIGIILNVTQDHLDRYESFDAYAASKFSLFKRSAGLVQTAVINADDPVCCRWASQIAAQTLYFSRSNSSAAAITDGRILTVMDPRGVRRQFRLDRWALRGWHNLENLMAATLAALRGGVDPQTIQEVIDTFRPSAHRMEWLGTVDGVGFINDSKGTNVGAVIKALESCAQPVVLLLGGRSKKTDFRDLAPLCAEKVRAVVGFGETGPQAAEELSGHVPTVVVQDLEKAFHEAVQRAVSGDVVLLSPGCASFDQYANYAARGDHFRALFEQHKKKAAERSGMV